MAKTHELGRIPPQNLEAEMSLLGSILLDKESISKVTDQILIGDFYSNAHNDIFAIMLEIYNKNESIDILTVSNRLTEKQLLQKVGGHSYLVKLSNAVPTASHITEYAKIVKRKAVHRKLIAAADKISELGYNEETQNTDEILDEAQQELFRIPKNILELILLLFKTY